MHRFDDAAGRAGRVQPALRRVDPPLPRARLPGGGARRDPAAGGRRDDLPHAPRRPSGRGRGRWRRSGDAGRPDRARRGRTARRGRSEAASYVAGAERNWAADEITWGILDVPESEVQMLGDVAGKDVVELGCGTAYVSSWLARRGARVVGVDLTEEQLATARAMQAKHGARVPAGPRERGGRAAARTRRSTSPSPSTARRSGATPTSGSPRPRGCSGQAASSSSSSTARS